MNNKQRMELYQGLIDKRLKLLNKPEIRTGLQHEKLMKETWCPGCQGFVYSSDKFCGSCGTENPTFNPESFEALFGFPWIKVKSENCGGSNNHHSQINGFCRICGVDIKTAEIKEIPKP